MTHQEDDLRIQTAAAVRQATSELRNDAGNSELFGFALCTDDDVRTLHQVACTRDWVRENEAGYPDIGFIYVEWTHSAGDALFDPISQQFATLADQKYTCDEDWAAARDRRFNLLVMALEDCRNAGVFAPDTLLCVGSTDPSDHLESLAMGSVDVLNTPVVANQFAKALGYEKHRNKT